LVNTFARQISPTVDYHAKCARSDIVVNGCWSVWITLKIIGIITFVVPSVLPFDLLVFDPLPFKVTFDPLTFIFICAVNVNVKPTAHKKTTCFIVVRFEIKIIKHDESQDIILEITKKNE
jgi:hypothetical protein